MNVQIQNRAIVKPHQRLNTALLVLLLTAVGQVNAQVMVKGVVSDSLGKPVRSVNVSLIKKTTGLVVAYAISDQAGTYTVQYSPASPVDTLLVQADMVGYVKQSYHLKKTVQTIDFTLHASYTILPEVIVKSDKPLLKLTGDTLSYDVASFSSVQDRRIIDVIKKIPGVEVDDNGKITVQGVPINRFYIDGENLLDGKYNIATNSLPNDIVSKIQVLNNHQPVNALKNIEQTNAPAMNFVLKDKAHLKVVGDGDLTLGMPGLYNGTINALTFKKKFQSINYFKFNNTGVDLADDLTPHFGSSQDNVPATLLSVGGGSPALNKKRWLFNNVGLINVNNLFVLKNDFRFRINASYLFDRQYQSSASSNSYFLPNDTVRYVEKQNNRYTINNFRTQFTLTVNKAAYYFNEVLILENAPQQVTGSLRGTSGNIQQQLSGSTTNFSNEINYIKTLADNRKVVEGYAYANTIRNPATLQVEPGLNADTFNNGIPFAALIQETAIPTFFTNNYLSYKIGGKFRQSYKGGFSYQQQQLNSQLQSEQLSGAKAVVSDSFTNTLHWQRLKIYVQADYAYFTNRIQLGISLPIVFMNTRYAGHTLPQQLRSLPVTPAVSLKYTIGKESYVQTRYSYSNIWGDIRNVYDGYIMQTYNRFSANDPFISETWTHAATVDYYFRNTLKVFFFNLGLSYKSNTANSITDNTYNAIRQQSKNIVYENSTYSKSINGSISKYLFALKTTVGIKGIWQQNGSNLLQNGKLLQYLNTFYSYSANAGSNISSWVNFTYSITASVFQNRPAGNIHAGVKNAQEVKNWKHQLDASLILQKDLFLKIGSEYYLNQSPGLQDSRFVFMDASCVYKLNKIKTDIELSLTNLWNTDSYTTISTSSNNILQYTYQIRPRSALLKFLFHF